MNVTTHHEIHPGAEILSAFAEQALSAKDRSAVLSHLAVCSRCREIVALTREAAGAEVEPARPGVVRPRAWWRSWGFVMAPAAAVAATAVIAIYVHQRDAERTAELAKLEQLHANENPPMLPQAPPQPPPEAAPAAAPHSAPTGPQKTDRTAVAKRTPTAEPDEMAAAPPPEGMNGLLPARGGPVVNPYFERREKNDEALPPTGAAPDDTMPNEAAAYDEERKKHVEEESEGRRQFAAKAPIPNSEGGSGHGTAGSSAASSTQPADVSAQQLETQPAPAAGSLQLHGLRSMMDVATGPYAFHLPSGPPRGFDYFGGSSHARRRRERQLFFARTPEGPGKRSSGNGPGAPLRCAGTRAGSTQRERRQRPEDRGKTQRTLGSLSQPETVFELVNDQSQVWISEDGRIWTARVDSGAALRCPSVDFPC